MNFLKNKRTRVGFIYFTMWGMLIIAGIVAKRVYGHPDMMVFFHLPAAVFLVLSIYILSEPFRRERQKHDLAHIKIHPKT